MFSSEHVGRREGAANMFMSAFVQLVWLLVTQ